MKCIHLYLLQRTYLFKNTEFLRQCSVINFSAICWQRKQWSALLVSGPMGIGAQFGQWAPIWAVGTNMYCQRLWAPICIVSSRLSVYVVSSCLHWAAIDFSSAFRHLILIMGGGRVKILHIVYINNIPVLYFCPMNSVAYIFLHALWMYLWMPRWIFSRCQHGCTMEILSAGILKNC